MRKVLVIDESDVFRDFVAQKLNGFGLEVIQGSNGFDGMLKIQAEHPDLVIMDYYLSRVSAQELLAKKASNPNAKAAPVIMVSARVDRDTLLSLAPLGVKKFLSKPIKVDSLVQAVAELLGVKLEIDNTPCIIDANYNDEMMVVEVALGLNKDKIELLRYRLQELVDLYSLFNTRTLLILSGIELSGRDSLLFSVLINTILEHSKTPKRNLCILGNSTFIPNFLAGREPFAGIKYCQTLDAAMDILMGSRADAFRDATTNTVNPAFLQGGASGNKGSEPSAVAMRFDTELRQNQVDLAAIGPSLRIAVVDDDLVVRAVVKKALASKGIPCIEFSDGQDFLAHDRVEDFDLVFLDLLMPRVDGFKVLQSLREHEKAPPVIVLSALDKKETIVKALSFKVKNYMVKPVGPEQILKKASDAMVLSF